jgi:hypothetical protein
MTNIDMTAAINNCWECRSTCQKTLVEHCLPMGGPHVGTDHVKLMLDCIEACQTSADFMTRGSVLHKKMCETCAAVCDACADSCDAIGSVEMKACADACRNCAVTCSEMSGMAKPA